MSLARFTLFIAFLCLCPWLQADDAQAHIQKVVSCLPDPVVLKDDPHGCPTLAARLAHLHVPGVSIAVVHDGIIEWAQGFGQAQVAGKPVNAQTLFQAGSISKPLAAMAALHLVGEGKLSLDKDVNTFLATWKVPPAAVAPNAQVTLRELLTHTAGFTVHGFPGYAAQEPVPTVVQVLNGDKPANTPAIRVESMPASKWNYSGGGYTVMQQVVLDVSKEPFPKLLHDTVLAPIGMTHSTYEQPLPSPLQSSAATPYSAAGKAIPGGAHTYPEMAAAGLWTTPSDLARYIIEIQQSLHGTANHVLSQQLTRQMLTPGLGNWGLGVELGGSATNPYFSHGGVNEGFESLFVGYEESGEGAAVMTNAEGGSRLAREVMSSIAVAYNWPDFRPKVRAAVKVGASVLGRYVGTYQLAPEFTLSFTLDGDRLLIQAPGQDKVPAFPMSSTKFFLTAVDAEVEFFSDDNGQVTRLVLRQGGHETKGVRK